MTAMSAGNGAFFLAGCCTAGATQSFLRISQCFAAFRSTPLRFPVVQMGRSLLPFSVFRHGSDRSHFATFSNFSPRFSEVQMGRILLSFPFFVAFR